MERISVARFRAHAFADAQPRHLRRPQYLSGRHDRGGRFHPLLRRPLTIWTQLDQNSAANATRLIEIPLTRRRTRELKDGIGGRVWRDIPSRHPHLTSPSRERDFYIPAARAGRSPESPGASTPNPRSPSPRQRNQKFLQSFLPKKRKAFSKNLLHLIN